MPFVNSSIYRDIGTTALDDSILCWEMLRERLSQLSAYDPVFLLIKQLTVTYLLSLLRIKHISDYVCTYKAVNKIHLC